MRSIIQEHPTLAARLLSPLILAALGLSALLVPARAAHATPEETCQRGRYTAAAKYSACQQKALAKLFGGGDSTNLNVASGKCRTKYAAVWPKLQAQAPAPGSACDTSRFTDNGTTVTDNLTALQWEKKQNLDSSPNYADPQDADNYYSWNAGASPFAAADGTVFTTFLPALNSGGCFAGQCDWRLPTIYELHTIVPEAYPCVTSPCIDPVFGPTVASGSYWSATSHATTPNGVWSMFFLLGEMFNAGKASTGLYVRAVRGGS